jgi:hypothetical protein
MARRSLRAAPGAHRGRLVVGPVHLAHCFGVSQAGLRAVCISRRAFFVGGRRGDHVSGVESICLPLDSSTRARHCQWRGFCRRWCGGGYHTGDDYLRDDSLWVAVVILDERRSRRAGGLSLVRCGARYAGGTSNGFSTRTGKHSRLGESNHGLRDIRLLRSNRQTRNRELGHHIR